MNAKGDANRSVRMTKQRLYQALITLLQQKVCGKLQSGS